MSIFHKFYPKAVMMKNLFILGVMISVFNFAHAEGVDEQALTYSCNFTVSKHNKVINQGNISGVIAATKEIPASAVMLLGQHEVAKLELAYRSPLEGFPEEWRLDLNRYHDGALMADQNTAPVGALAKSSTSGISFKAGFLKSRSYNILCRITK